MILFSRQNIFLEILTSLILELTIVIMHFLLKKIIVYKLFQSPHYEKQPGFIF